MDLKRYEKLKADCDRLQREVDRSEGALQQQMNQLLREYECASVKEAELELQRLESELRSKEQQFHKELEAFEKRFKEMAGGLAFDPH